MITLIWLAWYIAVTFGLASLALAWYPCCCGPVACETCYVCDGDTPCNPTITISGLADGTYCACSQIDGTYICDQQAGATGVDISCTCQWAYPEWETYTEVSEACDPNYTLEFYLSVTAYFLYCTSSNPAEISVRLNLARRNVGGDVFGSAQWKWTNLATDVINCDTQRQLAFSQSSGLTNDPCEKISYSTAAVYWN